MRVIFESNARGLLTVEDGRSILLELVFCFNKIFQNIITNFNFFLVMADGGSLWLRIEEKDTKIAPDDPR